MAAARAAPLLGASGTLLKAMDQACSLVNQAAVARTVAAFQASPHLAEHELAQAAVLAVTLDQVTADELDGPCLSAS